MTLNWKPQEEKFGGGDSCFGTDFREEYPELAELLSENGLYKHGKSCNDEKYQYTVKVVQNGKYIFVTRKLASRTASNTSTNTPPKTTLSDAKLVVNSYDQRQDAIQKNHDERQALEKEKLAFEREKFEFDKMIFSQNQALILQVVDLTHQVQMLVKGVVEIRDLFKTAAQVMEAQTK